MTVCLGPSTTAVVIATVLALVLPLVVSIVLYRLRTIRIWTAVALVVVLAPLLWLAAMAGLAEYSMAQCGTGKPPLLCQPFVWDRASDTCTLGDRTFNGTACGSIDNQLQIQQRLTPPPCPPGQHGTSYD